MRQTFPSPDAYNEAGDRYRDEVVRVLAAAGRPAPEPKWARSAGGFLAENGGDIGEAMDAASWAGVFQGLHVLMAYSEALRQLDVTPDPIAQAEAVARIRDDLTLNADPILSFLDRLVERAVWRSSDPDELVAAFAGAQAIEFRSRLRNYIAAVAQREANREASLRDALAASVIAANTRAPEGLRRFCGHDFPALHNDNEQPMGAA